MKKMMVIALFAIFTMSTYAQQSKDEISILQSAYGMQKRELVAKFMDVSEAQSATFWKLYEEYEVARKAIGTKRANNILEYAKKYDAITDENVQNMVKVSMEVHKEFDALWEKTYKKMSKALSPKTAAKFYQLELYLENMVRTELSESIPMIDELK
ncbi:hypothetical protein [Flavobacterium sp.]|uniref:hypothetical protein n=1 Tax=Flavobacterium sp. TaxID=239 RepID=UPI0025C5B6B1|nr:hypothetical protein [Flavobacterium sp.]MBA4153798.1 hypothetical protein [Flavobacterium sp.]